MTSPQQKLEVNETSKTKSGLNPNANAFFSKKDMPQAAWNTNDHVLNGEVSEHYAGSGLSSGDSPTSSSPALSGVTLDTGPQLTISMKAKPSSQLTGAGPDHPRSQFQCVPSESNGSVKPQTSVKLVSEGVALIKEAEPEFSIGKMPAELDKSLTSAEMDNGNGIAQLSSIEKSQEVNEVTTATPSDSKLGPVLENGIDVDVNAEQAVGDASLEDTVSSAKLEGEVGGATDTKFDPVLREKLQKQLEYYFSRENLEQDSYLQTQMDGNGWVFIAMVANFKKVMELTKHMDVPLVTDILKSLKTVQVDERGEKVRPNTNRSHLVLRELPEGVTEKDLLEMFEGDSLPRPISCESMIINNHFCLKFVSNEDCLQAHMLITNGTIRLRGTRVLGFIKSQNTRPMNQYNHGSGGGAPQQQQQHQHQQQHQQQPVPQQTQPQPALPNAHVFTRQLQQPPQQHIFAPAMAPLMSNQLQQTLPHGFYIPHLGAWPQAAPNPQFFDQAPMFSLANHNMKPGAPNHQPRMFHPIRHSHSHRGGKQHRPHSAHTDIRPQGHGNLSPARFNIRHNHPSTFEPRHPAPVVSVPTRPEAPAVLESVTTQAAVPTVTTAPQPLLAQDLGAQATAATSLSASGPKPDTSFLLAQSSGNRRSYNDSRRANQFHRKMRRNDDNSRNARSQTGGISRDVKSQEQFDLEKTSFPPLPGSTTNSSSGDTADGSRLADVVKGASTHTPRSPALAEEKPQTSISFTPSTSTVTVSVVKTSVTALANVSTSSSAGPKEKVVSNSGHAKPAAEFSCEKVPASSEPSRPSKASNSPAPSKPASQVLPPPPPPTITTSISVKAAASAAAKPTSASSGAQPKPSPASTASSVVPSAPPPAVVAAPKQGGAPARLSYAQMVARKQAETAAKAATEEGASAQTPPSGATAIPSPLSEQTPTPSSTSGSTSTVTALKAMSGGARPKEYSHNGGARRKEYSPSGGTRPKDYSHRNYEPREQRSQGSRRARDYRQSRYESRRNDRDSKN